MEREEGKGKEEGRGKEGEKGRKGGKVVLGSFGPRLLGFSAPRLMVGGFFAPGGGGGGLELLGACCVETAQFFFDHFREMQYPLFGAVERGRVG